MLRAIKKLREGRKDGRPPKPKRLSKTLRVSEENLEFLDTLSRQIKITIPDVLNTLLDKARIENEIRIHKEAKNG